MLRTKTKLRIARLLNRAIVAPRLLVGKTATVRVRRLGVNWLLDLNEGIDFAIYLGRYQSIPRRVIDEWIRPSSLTMDIGANIGAFSLPMLNHVGEGGLVIAVEPTDYAFDKFKANLSLNPNLVPRVKAVQAALTATDAKAKGAAKFYSRWPLYEDGSHRHAEHEGREEAARSARFLTLDRLLAELRSEGRASGRLSFVKLDADGNELTVLQGGRQTFMADRPAMLVEIAPHVQDEQPNRFEELLSTLVEYGYVLEEAVSGRPLPTSAAALRRAISFGASIDALARPN